MMAQPQYPRNRGRKHGDIETARVVETRVGLVAETGGAPISLRISGCIASRRLLDSNMSQEACAAFAAG